MALLYWLESIRNPVLDTVMSAITLAGSEAVFLVAALTVYWCVNKKEGYYILFVGYAGTVLSQCLKLACQIPRPWVSDPDFTIVEAARAQATGYSFPSGHTQNIAGTFGAIARWHRQNWLRIVCIVLIVLVSFSRMYLGVHTPLDVAVGFLISAVLLFVLYPLVMKAAERPKLMYAVLGVMTVLAFAYLLYTNLTEFTPVCTTAQEIKEELACIEDARKNSYSLLGSLLGFLLGYTIERKYVRFEEKAVWWVQLLKVAGGLGITLGIKEGLKALFNAVGFTWLGSNAIRYFAVVLFASAVWPLVFPLLRRISERRQTQCSL